MSLIGIYNAALVPLGVDRVMDPNEETEQARKCNEIWPYIRDDELSGHPWNFATVQTQCALTTESSLYRYQYVYQIPSDSLRIIEIYTNDDAYQVIGDKIHTNVSTLYIEYIKQVTDTNQYSSSFKMLCAARLKYELSFSLIGSRTMTGELYTVLLKERKRAKSIDATEGTPKNNNGSRITDCRRGAVR